MISSLSELNSIQLKNYFASLENHENIDTEELRKFLEEIDFKDEALEFLQLTMDHLDSDYFFKEEDLIVIIDTSLRSEYEKGLQSNQRSSTYAWGLTCDGFCTVSSVNAWPEMEGVDYQKLRSAHYVGCMDGCKNGPR